jgi:hypothetical protein
LYIIEIRCPTNKEQRNDDHWTQYLGRFSDFSVELVSAGHDQQGLHKKQGQPNHHQCSMNMMYGCIAFKFRELASIVFTEAPLNPY